MIVIVVTYQSEDHLEPCLRALLTDGVPGAGILVWDNASRDRSAEIAAGLVGEASVVRSKENLGFAAAVNRAAAMRPGQDLLLINPDAVVEVGTVPALTAALGDAALAVVGSRLLSSDGSPRPDAWRYPSPRLAILGSMIGLGRAYRPRREAVGGVEYVDGAFVPFTVALLRRSTFDALVGLDEDFWLYGEDSEYCYRAYRAGHRIAVATRARARHASGASSSEAARMRHQLEAGDRFRTKHFGARPAREAGRALRRGARARLWVGGLAGGNGPRRFGEWTHVLNHYSGK